MRRIGELSVAECVEHIIQGRLEVVEYKQMREISRLLTQV